MGCRGRKQLVTVGSSGVDEKKHGLKMSGGGGDERKCGSEMSGGGDERKACLGDEWRRRWKKKRGLEMVALQIG